MPWKKQDTPMELKTEFVQMADKPNSNMSRLCRRYNISRKTGYKWLSRYRKEGLQGALDRTLEASEEQSK
jgi:transposase-like protein